MRKSFLIPLIVCGMLLLSGNAFKIVRETPDFVTCETFVYVEKGDTFWNIVEPYYDKNTVDICLDEYMYLQRQLNNNLFKDGRALQIDDVVKIHWYLKKEKK